MRRKTASTLFSIACALVGGVAVPQAAIAQEASPPSDEQGTAPGVNPKDNITKAEAIVQYNNLEAGLETFTIALKYDLAFNSKWGANVELPFTTLSGPGFSETDVGDLNLRVRNVNTQGPVSILSAVEVVVPTAGSDLTGSGKWQVNPVVGAVYAFNQQTFAFLGYKHYFSIAGDEARDDINRSEVRALFARLFANATWTLGDVKYSHSYEGQEFDTLDLEVEYGSMISKSVAISGRVGTSFLDSSRDFGLSLNVRKIF